MQTIKEEIEVKCPHCDEEFTKEIEVDIYEPSIDINVEVK